MKWLTLTAIVISGACIFVVIGNAAGLPLLTGITSRAVTGFWFAGIATGCLALVLSIFSKGTAKERGRLRFVLMGLSILLLIANCQIPAVTGFMEAKVRMKVSRARNEGQIMLRQMSETSATLKTPIDPFRTNDNMRLRNDSDGHATLWSIGPDERDDDGLLSYDATNGTVSPGDVIVTK